MNVNRSRDHRKLQRALACLALVAVAGEVSAQSSVSIYGTIEPPRDSWRPVGLSQAATSAA